MRRLSNPLVLALVGAFLAIAAGRAAAVSYFIDVQTSGPGTVTPSGTVEVPAGGSQTFTFTPSGCFVAGDVTVDDVSVGIRLTEYTFTNVQSDHVLYVPFDAGSPTTTALEVRPTIGQCAVPDTLIASVPNADGGQVQFFNGATLLGTRTLTAGVATFVVSPGLPTGSYTFSASYLGTSCFDPSNSPAVSYDVADTGPTPVTLSVTLSRDILDQHTSVFATTTLGIDGGVLGAQMGQVTFYDGGIFLGAFAMANGHSSGTFTMDVSGVHVLWAVASPVQCPGTITSEPETLFVRESTSMTLTITPMQVDPGESVLMTAVVSPSYATGTIRFRDVKTRVEIGAASLVDGTASFTYFPLSVESRTVQALYDGDALVAACTSNQVSLKVATQPVVDTNLWITNGPVYSVVADGSTIYIGGDFTWVGPAGGGAGEPRYDIAALDATTGNATSWHPVPNGIVRSLAVSGSTVYVGGDFTSIGGQPRNRIAAIDATTGALTAWDPNVQGPIANDPYTIRALVVIGGTVFAGGWFTSIGGQTRNNIAALDSASGAATAWDHPLGEVYALAVSGGTVYVGGLLGITAVDATSGATAFYSNAQGDASGLRFSTIVRSLAVSGSTLYAGGNFTSIGGQARDCIAALDATSGNATAWDPNATNTVPALAVSGSTLYVGGWFRSIGGQPRNFIASLDAVSGNTTAWDPNAAGAVLALAVSGGKVYAGGNFTSMGGQPQANIAAISAPDIPVATLLAQFEATTSADGIELWWSFGDPSQVTTVVVERAPAVAGPWLPIAPELRDESGVTVALDRTAGESEEYFYRLVVQLTGGGQTVFGPVSASQRETPLKTDLKLLSANPTSGGSQVQYSVARAGRVRLEVLDVSGRVEETLADRIQTPGRYVVTWDGVGRHGRPSPGLYFVRLVTPDLVTTRKLAIIQ